jgi:hypothetical protein
LPKIPGYIFKGHHYQCLATVGVLAILTAFMRCDVLPGSLANKSTEPGRHRIEPSAKCPDNSLLLWDILVLTESRLDLLLNAGYAIFDVRVLVRVAEPLENEHRKFRILIAFVFDQLWFCKGFLKQS